MREVIASRQHPLFKLVCQLWLRLPHRKAAAAKLTASTSAVKVALMGHHEVAYVEYSTQTVDS